MRVGEAEGKELRVEGRVVRAGEYSWRFLVTRARLVDKDVGAKKL